MECGACGRDNEKGANFCDACGTSLVLTCPECGGEQRPDARFCSACGVGLVEEPRDPGSIAPPHLAEKILHGRAELEGERRTVTVLFADARGFTPISERLGEEESYRLTQGCTALMSEVVHRFEGTVNQFTGDGIMAMFGAPLAHEDSARRAVSAALEMQRALHDYAETVKARHPGIVCEFRVGLNTGPVVVGRIGDDLAMDYTAVGDTTNLASRMESMAEPGSVYLTEHTHREVADFFELEDLGPLEVKGKADPVRVYRAVGETRVRGRLEAEAIRGLTPFVGRESELALFGDFFEQVREGRGQIVLLSGEAGIGKSRLVLELRRWLAEHVTWWHGSCISYGERIPYLPVTDVLKAAFGIDEADGQEAIIRKVDRTAARWGTEAERTKPYLKWLLQVDPGDASVEEMDPRERKAGLLDGLRALVAEGARDGPLVLAVEDLHWVDDQSVEALRALVDVIVGHPVLCVITYRPGYEHGLEDLRQANRVVLTELREDDGLQMAQGLLEAPELPHELTGVIADKAEGNPLFIEEVTKALAESGVLRREGEGYALTRPPDEVHVPNTLQEVILSRVDRLEREAKEALQLASVIGREFTVRLLNRIADVRAELEHVLAELRSLELIYEKAYFPELEYMFKHALTHEVCYSTLLSERRQTLHRVVGSAIEELYGDRLAEQYEVLAHHYSEAEAWEQALWFLELSGDKSESAFASDEAIAYDRRAADVAERLNDEEAVARVSEKGGLVALGIARFDHALGCFQRMREVGRRLANRRMEGMALVRAGVVRFWMHEFGRAQGCLEEALEVGGNDPDVRFAARNWELLLYLVEGRLEEAEALRELVDGLADEHGQTLDLGWYALMAGMVPNWSGDFEGAIRFFDRWEDPLKRGGVQTMSQRPMLRAWALAGKGAYEEALRGLEEAMTLAERAGVGTTTARALNTLGWIYNDLQDPETALEWNRRAVDYAVDAGFPNPECESNGRLNLGDSYLALGDLDAAEEQYGIVEAIYRDPRPQDHWMLWRYAQHLLHSRGELLLRRGEAERALGYADECLEAAERTESRKNVVKAGRLRGRVFTVQGRLEDAERELMEAVDVARSVGNPPQLWKTWQALGKVLEAQGRPEEARSAYVEALRVIEDVAAGLSDERLRRVFSGSPEVEGIRRAASHGGR